MKKLYKSKTSLAVNISLKGGGYRHISFVPQSDGGSVYISADENVQYGLEHHRLYGKVFREEAESEEPEDTAAEKADDGESKKFTFTDREAARDFLAEQYGISRTKMKTKKDIETAAKANGIEIEYGG